MDDKINDVLSVLKEIRDERTRNTSYASITELRKRAVKTVAEREFKSKRFSDIDSANKSIHDACVRRLKIEINNVSDFDKHVEDWLHGRTRRLQEILIKKAKNNEGTQKIKSFFEM